MSGNRVYFISGGGTGGHIYPAFTIVDKLLKDEDTKKIYFIGNPNNLEFNICKNYPEVEFLPVDVTGMPRKLNLSLIKWAFTLFKAFIKAFSYLKKYNPDAVFTTGGYVSAPIVLASIVKKKPYMIHDCDSVPGLVSKLSAPKAKVVSVAFECAKKILKSEKSERRLNFNLCVLISVLKQEAMHLAIENAVQLGAKEIYTVYSDNASIKKDLILNKAEKWQKIGTESFKQCERADMPKVFDILKFDEIFSKFKKENILVFAEKYDEFSVKEACLNLDKNEKILAVFGPEGGFSEKEFEYFKNENIKLVTLGKLILKAPNAITAGLFGVIQNV